jgi:hypothetical protein
MNIKDIDILTIGLSYLSGWLTIGWLVYLLTIYKYEKVSKRQLALLAGPGNFIGFTSLVFAMKADLITVILTSISATAVTLFVVMVMIPKKPDE